MNEDADSDHDGMPDGWENEHFDGPTNAMAALDNDNDGVSNQVEYIIDTDPWVVSPPFLVLAITNFAGRHVEFNSSPNRHYAMEFCTNNALSGWYCVPARDYQQGTGGSMSLGDTNNAAGRLYRVRVTAP
jgi:hypothetical protein